MTSKKGAGTRAGRAVELLNKVLEARALTRAEMAEELVVSPGQIEAYRSGAAPMPLDRQLLLALLVMSRVPQFARAARSLRGQVAAAAAYESGETSVHLNPPPTSGRW